MAVHKANNAIWYSTHGRGSLLLARCCFDTEQGADGASWLVLLYFPVLSKVAEVGSSFSIIATEQNSNMPWEGHGFEFPAKLEPGVIQEKR